MQHNRNIPILLSIVLILMLAFSALGAGAAHAAQTVTDAVPSGLSAEDWSQIKALLPPAQQAYLKASNTGAGDLFGFAVAISGDTLVVGVPYEDSNATGVNGDQADNSAGDSGAAYVFTRSGTTWSWQAYLKASNTGAGDWFGRSVAISGDTLVVGASNEDSAATGVGGNQADNSAADSGAAYVFTRSGTTWSQAAYLKASNTETNDIFGFAVAISGDTLVVGAHYEDSSATGVGGNQADNSAADSGAAYVFTRDGTTWSQAAYLKASNAGANDYFSYSLAISEDTLVVGAPFESSNATGVNGDQNNNSVFGAGAAYVFTCSGTTWSQQAYLKASNTGANDFFGKALAISGDTLVIGAPEEDSAATGVNGNQADNSASAAGAAYVFFRSGATWSQQAYLKASNTGVDDNFSYSVAISGDTLVVGAPREDSAATGVDGDQANNTAANSGAAYVFTRGGTAWSQQVYLKASNTESGDFFGYGVAVSGDTRVVSAYFEDSNATGVNGNQLDNSAAESGAAYVFLQKHTTTYRSSGTYDGHVLESGENTSLGGTLDRTSATFILGDGAQDKQYRAILHFNTGPLPDNAVITKATLKIRRQTQVGTNPFTILGGLKVDMRKPYFGTGYALLIGDFQAAAGKNAVANFGATPVNYWYRANLNAIGRAYLSKTGVTQFRLRFTLDDNNDNAADYMRFCSGNYATLAARPTLIVEYYVP